MIGYRNCVVVFVVVVLFFVILSLLECTHLFCSCKQGRSVYRVIDKCYKKKKNKTKQIKAHTHGVVGVCNDVASSLKCPTMISV